MSVEALLAAIEASGEAEAARMQAEAESRVQRILDEARRKAAARREQMRQAALLPAASERARRLHQARLEALNMVGQVRYRLADEAVAQTQRRLVAFRADPAYPLVLRRLVEQAIRALGIRSSDADDGADKIGACSEDPPVLEGDPRDEVLLHRCLDELGLDFPIQFSLNCWGGVVASSSDSRIVVTNTLEARLERATLLLRRDLAARLEQGLNGQDVRF